MLHRLNADATFRSQVVLDVVAGQSKVKLLIATDEHRSNVA